MKIKPIRTEADHKAALAEIEQLWSAEPNTPEGDKLDVLATLVDTWERKHTPISPPDENRKVWTELFELRAEIARLRSELGFETIPLAHQRHPEVFKQVKSESIDRSVVQDKFMVCESSFVLTKDDCFITLYCDGTVQETYDCGNDDSKASDIYRAMYNTLSCCQSIWYNRPV